MKLFVIRHGETLWNKLNILQGNSDSDLLDTTIIQTLNLKEKFRKNNINFDVICSSPSIRAKETARLLGYKDIFVKKEFSELGMGMLQGKTYEEFKSLYPQEYYNYFNNPKDYNPTCFKGETYGELVERIEIGMRNLEKEFRGKKVLLVTHGVTIQGIISYSYNRDREINDFSKIPLPKNLELIKITSYYY